MSSTRPSQSVTPPQAVIRPAGRASWIGQLSFHDLAIPVKAYSLSVTAPSGPLCQIHAGCGKKVEYRKVCPEHGQLPNDQIGRAYPYAENDLVELSEQELQPLAPNPEQVATITQFFSQDELSWSFLSGRCFSLIPAHSAAEHPYWAFAEALQNAAVLGFGTIGLSGRRQLLVTQSVQHQILLALLHWPAQRRAAPVSSPTILSEAKSLSAQLLKQIRTRTAAPDWGQCVDDWEQQLASVVQQKVARRTPQGGTSLRPRRSSVRVNAPSRTAPARRAKVA